MTIDASRYPASARGPKAAIWMGQMSMMVIEGTLFAVLLIVYLYVRAASDVWPPPGHRAPDLFIPTVSLLVLLVSCIPMLLAGKAVKRDNWRGALLWTWVNVGMALVFLALRTVELNRLDYKWTSDIFASIAWCVLGLHTMHAAADIAESVVIAFHIGRGWRGEKQKQAVEVDGLYWYFVAVVWIPFYLIFFLFP